MSALGSSVISKSAKKFAPKKAPARRPKNVDSSQASTRPSADREISSQTPNLQPVQPRITASPVSSVSVLVPPPSDQLLTPALTQLQRENESMHVLNSNREPSIIWTPSTQLAVSQKRTLDQRETAEQQTSVNSPQHATPPRKSAISPSADALPAKKPSSNSARSKDPSESIVTEAPAAKRRKVSGKEKQRFVASQSLNEADPNFALPTTETGDVAVEEAIQHRETPSSAQTTKKRTRISAAEKRKQQKDGVASKMQKPRKSQGSIATLSREAAGQETVDDSQIPQDEREQSANGPSAEKPKKPAKKRGKKAMENAAAAIVDDALQGSSRFGKKRDRRTKRGGTPDEAQHVQIDISEKRMSDLCADEGTGQKSSADKTIRENERAAALKKKQREAQQLMGQADEPITEAENVSESRIDRLDRERREGVGNIVPQQQIVNGEIVVDTSSLRIDRHAIAAVERDAEQLEYVEEDEYTRKVNSGIGLKRDKSSGWNEELVDLFYEGLRMFGTDFGMISKMFPGKTRHAIKLKFCREEKEHESRIRETLLGDVLPVELEEFQKMTGKTYEDPAILERDIEEDKRKLEEEQEQEKQAIEVARKERAEQAEAERLAAAQAEESSGKENRRRRKRKSSKGKKAVWRES